MAETTAGAYADECVACVRDDPQARLRLLNRLYRVPADVDRGYLPYRRAASAFMGWQVKRGLLNPESDPAPGSPWWRALNEALLRDTCEASALAFGRAGEPRTAGTAAALGFIREPTARTWYRAHNTSIASAYLANEDLARREGHVERSSSTSSSSGFSTRTPWSPTRGSLSAGWLRADGCSETPGWG